MEKLWTTRGLRRKIWCERFGTASTAPCHWCGCELTFDDATTDHEPALSRGGRWWDGVISCWGCNNSRGNTPGPPPGVVEPYVAKPAWDDGLGGDIRLTDDCMSQFARYFPRLDLIQSLYRTRIVKASKLKELRTRPGKVSKWIRAGYLYLYDKHAPAVYVVKAAAKAGKNGRLNWTVIGVIRFAVERPVRGVED